MPSWPPARPALTKGERIAFVALIVAVTVLYLARLSAGSRELSADDEQCTKWPPYQTTRCYEMIPLDEVHYVPDARDVLRFGTESDTRVPTEDDGAFVVHPPVGKWFIAAGMAILGDNPVGWRVGNALAGIGGVLMMFAIARRLFGSARWSLVAAGLLAIDGLWFTMSRLAMLDISASVLTLAVVWGTVEILARIREDRTRSVPLLATGLAAGLAIATKWSVGSFLVVAALAITIAEASAWRKRRSHSIVYELEAFGPDALDAWAASVHRMQTRPRYGGPTRLAATLAAFSVLPMAVYVATFAPWFVDGNRYLPPACEQRSPLIAAWACYQGEQLSFHRNLEKYEPVAQEDGDGTTPVIASTPAHPYFGHGISWAWLGRPVVHNYFSDGEGDQQRIVEVMGVPNPLVWWVGFGLALPWLVARSRKDRTARILLAFFAAGWLPYLLADLVARPVFLFYATPLIPIVVLSASALARRLFEGTPERPPIPFVRGVVAGAVIGALGIGLWMYPIHAGIELPPGDLGWNGRIWFTTDCSEPGIKVLCWI
ncbi:MAG: glycosyltransferase family 39 protein [Actinomycetota bacterium]